MGRSGSFGWLVAAALVWGAGPAAATAVPTTVSDGAEQGGSTPRPAVSISGTEAPGAPRVVRGPWLLRVLDDSADLLVDTERPSRAEVRWSSPSGKGREAGAERSARDRRPAAHHLLHLSGLHPGRAYRYRITVENPAAPEAPVTVEAAFHTAPSAGHALRFVVCGDTRSGHDVHAQVVQSILAEDPDFVLQTGDLVAAGSDESEWARFFDIEAALGAQYPVYSAVGNHEYYRAPTGLRRFQELFDRVSAPTWWSFDTSGVHVVLLDSEAYGDPAQRAWLERDLAEARARKPRAIFAAVHHGPWSTALHGDNPTAIAEYAPLLAAAHVSILFAGHDHDFERGHVGRLHYVVSGGGGAELRVPRCGAPGKPRCPARVDSFINEHHYIVVDVRGESVRLCPKRPDGSALEACTYYVARP